MKKNLLLWSVLMGSIIGFTSCSDDDKFVEPTKPTLDGTDIEIGAVAGYEPMKSTRTIYPGQEVELTPEKRIEKINWVLGDEYTGKEWLSDEIQVYSPEALPTNAGNQWAQYKLVAHSETNPSLAIYPGDIPSDGGNTTPGGATPSQSYTDEGKFHVTGKDPSGLKWNPNEGTHYFYAVYPSANLNPSVKLEKRAGDIYFNGKISPFQATVGYMKDPSASIATYMAMPVMRQNYMWAVHASTEAEKIDNSIGLDFRTIPTALELDLVWPERYGSDYSIKAVRLSYVNGIQNENICGEFEANLSSASEATASSDRVYPTVTAVAQPGVSNNSIEINLDADPLHQKSGIQLEKGEHLKVRFLMLPHQEWDGTNLRLTIIGEKGQLSHMLAGTKGTFTLKPHKLNRIKNIPLPETFDVTNWISQLPDNVMLSQLSIPGTGSSYLYTPTNPTVYAQCKTVEEQWNMGIRCFDITVAGNADSGVGFFGDAHLRIDNKTEIGVTVGEAFTKLLNNVKLTNPDGDQKLWKGEFGMMIVRYQPKGTRHFADFITDFENYFKTLPQDRICLYHPSLTVGEARGKIMVILCPTSEGEDDLSAAKATLTNYLMVNGCGSLPDKFYKRGYSYDGKNQVLVKCANKVAESNRYQTAEYYIYNNQADKLSILKDAVDFTYGTNQTTFNAYMQDWLRVIDGAANEVNTFNNVNIYEYGDVVKLLETKNLQWRSSYLEKYNNVVNTFEKAVADKDHADLVYINSLCGFLASEQNRTELKQTLSDELVEGQFVPISNAHWPAVSGNIKALSDKLNPAFYKYVYDQLRSGTVKGPMGVVLMNFVGDKDSHGSDLLPSMVISNNFSFPLKTGTPGSVPDSGNTPDTSKDDPMPNADGSYDAGGWLWGE